LTSADDRGVITFDMATLRRTGHIPAQIEGYPLNHQTGLALTVGAVGAVTVGAVTVGAVTVGAVTVGAVTVGAVGASLRARIGMRLAVAMRLPTSSTSG
jgi:hypothetical protein